jgi:hypothetical protein
MRWQCEGAQHTTFGQLCMVLSLYRCKEEELLIERAGKTRAIRCWEGSASGRLPEEEIRVLNNDEESVQGRGALGRPEFTQARGLGGHYSRVRGGEDIDVALSPPRLSVVDEYGTQRNLNLNCTVGLGTPRISMINYWTR